MASLRDLIGAYQEKPPVPVVKEEEQPSSGKPQRKTLNRNDEKNNEDKSRKRKRQSKQEPHEKAEEEEEVEVEMDDVYQQEDYGDRTSGMEHDEFYKNYDDTLQALYQQEPQQQPSQLQKQQSLIDKVLSPDRKAKEKKQTSSKSTLDLDVVGETKYSNSAAGRYEPRRKRRVKITVPREEQYQLETAQEVEKRIERLETGLERSQQVRRWKLRGTNMQEEDDIGNV
ncbi:MAG: hypothetical protein SGARI_006769, partial [Bacillariaceae sp.]